ncbi:Threonylcarbamoyladenosine tRNA methylthiotransferase MtaB [Nymphon striatum]|nr:Threonylcarbamoyladenosine tRNA methylthiotransferase MtaB [Nymphon striatum]
MGPLLEFHPVFADRVNISIANVVDRGHIILRTWERGAGITQACGSAACAAAVCAVRKDLTDRKVTVTVPGGCLMDIEDETGDENLKVLTFGCRLNAYESEVMLRKAREAGLQELDGGSILVNTCAVTGTAVKSAQAAIRRARRENPDARIIVSGCAAQTEAQTFGDMGEVDLVIGNEEKLHAQSYRSLPDFGVNDTEKVAG